MSAVTAVADLFHAATRVQGQEFRDVAVHMIGIGGSGMCGLAAMLMRRGARVSGTDQRPSILLARLNADGARISFSQNAEAVPPEAQLVVASAAVPDHHPELLEARRRGLTIYKYAQLLGALMDHYQGVAVSGTHGKSTTSAWLSFVLREAGLSPNFIIGADVEQLGGGSGTGDGPLFVAEACEYDRSFLNLHPHRAVILNVEEDHLDCYADLAEIEEAFYEFARRVPHDGLLVLNAADPRSSRLAGRVSARVETFGVGCEADWRADDLELAGGCYAFNVSFRGRKLGRVRIGLSGRHNVANALAVIALANDCGVAWPSIQRALPEFRGARRRLELRGEPAGVRVVDDYAHHPTEIQATLAAARERFQPKRLWVVFQPHQHSRTRFLLDDFSRSFSAADFTLVPDIYFVRDSQRDREAVRAEDLVERIVARGGDALHIPEFGDIVEHLAARVTDGDVVLTMGAGTIWKVADDLIRRLGEHRPG